MRPQFFSSIDTDPERIKIDRWGPIWTTLGTSGLVRLELYECAREARDGTICCAFSPRSRFISIRFSINFFANQYEIDFYFYPFFADDMHSATVL